MLSFRSVRKRYVWAWMVMGFMAVGTTFAQDYSTMGISAVVNAADMRLQRGDYRGAIPALKEVIARTINLTDPQGRETLQMCRFELARAYYQVGDIPAGMKEINAYINGEPRKRERLALRMLAQGLVEIKEWDKIEEISSRLLKLPNLDDEDAFNGNLLLGQALFQQEKWADCVAPLTYASRESKNPKIATLCQIMAVRALVEAKSWSELFSRIPAVYRTDAKYDISLNLTLMRAGKAQFESASNFEPGTKEEAKAYLNALLLYRMVLSRDVMLDHAQKNIDRLTEKLAADVQVGIAEYEQEERQQEIDAIQESMATLRDLPDYEDEVSFRIGQIYAEVKRYWEGYVLFDSLYHNGKDSEVVEASMLQSILILYDIQEGELAEKRILAYLDEKPDGKYARTLLVIALRNGLQTQQYEKMIALQPYVDSTIPTTDVDELQLQADLHFLLAFGYFQTMDYTKAITQYNEVLENYSNSPNFPDARYYRGMASLMLGDYATAKEDFRSYQKQHPTAAHFSAAMFREAICLFGLEQVAESEQVFTKFIDTYPTDALVAEAYSMRGDIEASKEASVEDPDTLDRAVRDYRKAIDSAQTGLQASYPAFQAAKVFKLESKWQQIIDLMNYYIDRWEEKADVAEAVFWIGQSQIELGQVDEGIDAYMEAIERFGNDATLEGIDKIIQELVKLSRQHLSPGDREGLLIRIKLKLTSVDESQRVLNLRLRVAKAYLEGEDAAKALGVELINAEQDLETASSLALALMCDAAVSSENTEQMGRLYDYFVNTYEESEMLWQAYRAKAHQLLAQEDYNGVLATIDKVQGMFGADTFMGWAQMMKADTLYKTKQFEEAEKAYHMIMGVSDWRGALFAEGMYGMGMCRLALKDYATAHSFFQRTYLLFKGYADGDWAAKAYLAAAKCLVLLDRPDDARNTLQAMLDDNYTNTNLLADMAREQLKKYGSQE